MFSRGGSLVENPAPGRKRKVAVPLDTQRGVRKMDRGGVPRSRIAESLGVSRSTVRKYADMEGMSPVPLLAGGRPHPASDPYAG